MITFVVNGAPASSDAPPDTPLLWVIREGLKLTGTKFGCGAGLCGACMVHIDGKRDVPPMYVEVIETDNKPTGVGQMATPLITPAVSNAVMALTGVRLRHAPFIEERVKKALA